MSNPCVDVIIPTFNGMPLLRETVEAVVRQTYSDLRIVVVDDGSTDEGATADYVLGLRDPRISYLSVVNGGPSAARNQGIAASSSPYVAFLDADDLWYPHKLEKQMALLLADPGLGLVYGYHDILDEDGQVQGALELTRRGWIFDELLRGNCVAGSASMVVVPRRVLEQVGTFREDFLPGEDWELWMRIAHQFPVDLVPERIVGVRSVPGGVQRDPRNSLALASGLTYMLPRVIAQFGLGGRQRATLTGTIMRDAAYYYVVGGDLRRARRCVITLLKANPRYLLRPDNWVEYARALVIGRRMRRYGKVALTTLSWLKRMGRSRSTP